MRTFGQDRARRTGERVILQSSLPKGWTPRAPKTATSSEHPGTTVLWDDEYFEVVEAAAVATGGVRYVLMPWSDRHTIRTLQHYDAESEAARIADHALVHQQRRAHLGATVAAMFLGFLPAPVQNHLQNEVGVPATRMTLLSCALPFLILGIAVYLVVGAALRGAPLPVPLFLLLLLLPLSCEAFIRFFVVMSQNRPMGSIVGVIGYAIFRAVMPNRDRLPPTVGGRGDSIAFTPPSDDVALRDSFDLKAPLLTLLPAAEQRAIAERFAYDCRKHAFGVAWLILVCSGLGVVASWHAQDVAGILSRTIAMLVAGEQAIRVLLLRRGPVGSAWSIVVRPLVRDLLR